MRHPIGLIFVGLGLQNLGIMLDAFAAGLVEVDNPYLSAKRLPEPNGGAVAYAQIPRRIYRKRRIMRNVCDPSSPLALGNVLTVVSTDDGRFKRAFELLFILFRRHLPSSSGQLALRQDACLRRWQEEREPVWVGLRPLKQVEERIASLWRSDERSCSLPVSQHRADDRTKDAGIHIRVFVQCGIIQVATAQGIWVVGAVNLNALAAD